MKKLLCLAIAATMLLMVACGGTASSSQPAASAGADSSAPAASAPANTGTDAETIVIGGLAPLTGDAAQYGIAVNNGVKLAVEEINAAGGVLGKQVELIMYDDQHDPTAATTAYDRLVNEDNIVALVGAVTTAPTIAVAQKAAADGIPMITPTGTGAAITEIGPNIFRACFTDPFQGELMAHYALKELEAKTVAILYETGSDYSKGVAEAFEATAKELGLTITAKEAYQTGTTDFKAQLTKIKEGNPDVVMAPSYYGEAAMILGQARDLGITSKFVGPDGWDGLLNQIDKSNVQALNGAYYCTQFPFNEPGTELKRVMDAYTAEFGDEYLNMFAMLGYEAMHMMAAAIENAGNTDSDAIVEAMHNLVFEGLAGPISFKGGNDPERATFIIQFEDGKEKLLGEFGIND